MTKTFGLKKNQGEERVKAVVLKTFDHATNPELSNLIIEFCESRGYKISVKQEGGRSQYLGFIPAALIEVHFQMGEQVAVMIVNDPIWEESRGLKLKRVESDKLQERVLNEQLKAAAQARAQIDRLKASGMTEEQAKETLKAALGL